MRNPRLHMLALRRGADRFVRDEPTLLKQAEDQEIKISFEGSFGRNSVSPRGLNSTQLNNLVEVEGIVTKCSSVRPKLVKSVHLTEKNSYVTHVYKDANSLEIGLVEDNRMYLPTAATVPTHDANGDEMSVEHGLCEYKDYQTVTLQEMPERARVGQLPRSVEVILEHDLVDHVKPGDRVQCIGVYRPLARTHVNGAVKPIFGTHLLCNSVKIIGVDVGGVQISQTDAENINNLSERKDVLSLMAKSLCPSIFGHEFVKRALILQLLGGVEKTLENGTHLRGDVNCLLVGDPSTAKSQLLRSVMDIAPLAISSTGRGSSGVGLTAAVTVDQETGEKRLEAGAMVLADRGCVCIDEFDKMSENDRVAIHEVMEQQTVTIAKAGLHASLNARCSVVAAANPVYGQYDKTRRPQENIGLPDSLLSRFDLLFVILDQLDPALDRTLSEHVIKSHQYRRPGTVMEPEPLNQVSVLDLEDPAERAINTPVWQRGGRGSENSRGDGSGSDVLTKDFLRKYIYYAKQRASPVLSEEAVEAIGSKYATMRAKSGQNNLPVTARTLETIIRVATANAKARIADTVEVGDVEAATELINFCLFHEIGDDVVNNGGGGRRVLDGRGGTGSSSSSSSSSSRSREEGAMSPGGTTLQSQLSPDRPNKKARTAEMAVNDENSSGNINRSESLLEQPSASMSVDLRPLVIEAIQSLSAENPDDGIPKDSLLKRLGGHGESVEGVDAVLAELANEAKIYIEDSGGDEVIQTLQA